MLGVFASWCNGSTSDFDSECLGSNPSEATNFILMLQMYKNRFAITDLLGHYSSGSATTKDASE